MSHDFAKKPATGKAKPKKAPPKPAPRRKAKPGASKQGHKAPEWLWLCAGIIIGLLLAFLLQLARVPVTGGDTEDPQAKSQQGTPAKTQGKSEEFTFWEVLPTNEIIVEEPATPPAADAPQFIYFLQAGSFPNENQAESRRGEIGLLGEQTHLEQVSINGQPRFRVMIGPIEGRSYLSSIRNKLAAQGIQTLTYKRPKP